MRLAPFVQENYDIFKVTRVGGVGPHQRLLRFLWGRPGTRGRSKFRALSDSVHLIVTD